MFSGRNISLERLLTCEMKIFVVNILSSAKVRTI